jgi:iron complex outermembrane receptor protein
MRLFLFLFAASILCNSAYSQSTIKGSITSAKKSIPFATVNFKNIDKSILADSSGNFSKQLEAGSYIIEVTSAGYQLMSKKIVLHQNEVQEINFQLIPLQTELNNIVVVGSRSFQRNINSSPLPIDILRETELSSTGQLSLDKQLAYKLPSFNTANIPVADATTLFDPYEIRNLGASRTLILVNGKRKSPSSLLNLTPSVGRGETGSDLTSIPIDAIKRIEVLRDGASAQYGSGAIAGVMNVILKDDTSSSTILFRTGITSKGDGAIADLSYNSGHSLGGKGFVNYTLGFTQQQNAIRTGTIDVKGEQATFGGTPQKEAAIANYLKKYPTANHKTSIGEYTQGKFLLNIGYPINSNTEMHGNFMTALKQFKSNANFRPPYWRKDFGLLHTSIPGAPNYTGGSDPLYDGYIGYGPGFNGDLSDYNGTIGFQTKKGNWNKEISVTFGGNTQLYTVDQTVNASLGSMSPTYFKSGGYAFHNLIGNFDLSRKVNSKLTWALGSEFRKEIYKIIAGSSASYYGEGANSFPGIKADDAFTSSRLNLGVYSDASFDITKKWFLNAAIRGEYYSDFGPALIWKIASRYNIYKEILIFRASASTGFKSPDLHQIYTQQISAVLNGGNINLYGLFNNQSKEVFALGIPKLRPEAAKNYSMGLSFRPNSKMNISIDYYDITIANRIILTTNITSKNPSTVLYNILQQSDIVSMQFFTNAVKTRTSGIDISMGYKNINIGRGKLGFDVAGNMVVQNKLSTNVNTPEPIKQSGISLIDEQIRCLIERSRPRSKFVFGTELSVNKFIIYLNNSLFGKAGFQDVSNGGDMMNHVRQEFKPGLLTDLTISQQLKPSLNLSFSINNIFNVLPKWNLVALDALGVSALADPLKVQAIKNGITFNGRYPNLSYYGAHFNQLGTMFEMSVKVNL